ncbi:ImuA family protein [Sphingomonas antarctica]|uniref:ImuA family protein n=1 Tax=Sphingomonas antarctica TaxID=2040274 RepID=UPI0039EA6593
MIHAPISAPGTFAPAADDVPNPTGPGDRIAASLVKAALHEFAADDDQTASASAFALLANPTPKPILWVRDDRAQRQCGRVYGPGLVDLGIDPTQLILVTTPDAKSMLKASVDGLRCGSLGLVLIELWGRSPALDLTATRRLTLAAERSGVKALLVRANAVPEPSAAWTRWRIGSAPSAPFPADAPGHACFQIELLRDRAGRPGFATQLEWNRDDRQFRDPYLSGAVAALPVDRAPDPGWRRAG